MPPCSCGVRSPKPKHLPDASEYQVCEGTNKGVYVRRQPRLVSVSPILTRVRRGLKSILPEWLQP